MAAAVNFVLKPLSKIRLPGDYLAKRFFRGSLPLSATQSGKYKATRKKDRPLTYEQANPPYQIAHRKSWNSWNTSTLEDGLRTAETAIEEIFVRKFLMGTFHDCWKSNIIIKRQHNLIRISGILMLRVDPIKMNFLIGYSEELLSHWLQCHVIMEPQFISNDKDVVYTYV